jgi:hypothetical protein
MGITGPRNDPADAVGREDLRESAQRVLPHPPIPDGSIRRAPTLRRQLRARPQAGINTAIRGGRSAAE